MAKSRKVPHGMKKGGSVKKYDQGGGVSGLDPQQLSTYNSLQTPLAKDNYLQSVYAKGGKVKGYVVGGYINGVYMTPESSGMTPQEFSSAVQAEPTGSVTNTAVGNLPDASSSAVPGSVYGTIGNLAGQAVQNYIPTGKAGNPTYGVIGKDIASDALKDAGTGAAVGTAFAPGIGTLVGGAIGAGVGALQGWDQGVKQKKQMQAQNNQSAQAMGQLKVGSAYRKGGLAKKLSMPVKPTMPMPTMAKGGLTAEKAKLILKDGTIYGKKISDRQRKFFGAIAGGEAQKLAGGGGAGGGGGVGGGGGMGGGGGASGGGGGIPALGPVEHAKKPKGLLYADGGVAKHLEEGGDAHNSSGQFTVSYNPGTGGYYKFSYGTPLSRSHISNISKEEWENNKENQVPFSQFGLENEGTQFRSNPGQKLYKSLLKTGQELSVDPKAIGQSNLENVNTPVPTVDPSQRTKDISAPATEKDKAENIVPAKSPTTPQNAVGAPATANTDELNSAPTVVDKAKGGKIVGKGGPKEDKIPMKVAEGSFVVPAMNANKALALRKKYLADGGGVKESNEVDDSRNIRGWQGTEEEKEAARKDESPTQPYTSDEGKAMSQIRNLTRHPVAIEQLSKGSPVKKAGASVGKGEGESVPVKVSNGEHVFTPEEVAILKKRGVNLNALAPHADNKIGKANGGTLPDNQTLNGAGVQEEPNDGSIKDVGLKKGGGIHINPANKGKFNATKKATGKTTEQLTHSSNPLTKKRAVFAENAKHWNHKDQGGIVGALNAMVKGGRVQKKADGGNIIDSRQKQIISSPQEADVQQKVNSKIVVPTANQAVVKKKFINTQTNIGGAIPNFTVSGQDALKKGGLAKKLASGGVIQTGVKGPDDTALIKISRGNVAYNANGGKINKYQDGTPGTGAQGPNAPSMTDYVKHWGTSTNHAYLAKGGKVNGYTKGGGITDAAGNPLPTSTEDNDTDSFYNQATNDANANYSSIPKESAPATPDEDQDSGTDNSNAGNGSTGWDKTVKAAKKYGPTALAFGQAGLGLAQTLSNKRPTYTIPPEVQAAYASAQQQATYGLDPASKAAIQNQIAQRTNTSRGLIAGIAGGSAANAFRMIQNANATGGNSLIQMYAQDAAAKRAKQSQAYGLAGKLGDYRNFAYQQDMQKFLQNQQAGANLLGAGIHNLYQLNEGDKTQAALSRANQINPQGGYGLPNGYNGGYNGGYDGGFGGR